MKGEKMKPLTSSDKPKVVLVNNSQSIRILTEKNPITKVLFAKLPETEEEIKHHHRYRAINETIYLTTELNKIQSLDCEHLFSINFISHSISIAIPPLGGKTYMKETLKIPGVKLVDVDDLYEPWEMTEKGFKVGTKAWEVEKARRIQESIKKEKSQDLIVYLVHNPQDSISTESELYRIYIPTEELVKSHSLEYAIRGKYYHEVRQNLESYSNKSNLPVKYYTNHEQCTRWAKHAILEYKNSMEFKTTEIKMRQDVFDEVAMEKGELISTEKIRYKPFVAIIDEKDGKTSLNVEKIMEKEMWKARFYSSQGLLTFNLKNVDQIRIISNYFEDYRVNPVVLRSISYLMMLGKNRETEKINMERGFNVNLVNWFDPDANRVANADYYDCTLDEVDMYTYDLLEMIRKPEVWHQEFNILTAYRPDRTYKSKSNQNRK